MSNTELSLEKLEKQLGEQDRVVGKLMRQRQQFRKSLIEALDRVAEARKQLLAAEDSLGDLVTRCGDTAD